MSKLYNNIINAISKGLKKSLFEMARLSINRTIDKKLWLSVSSTISKNKVTDSEFIKPIGSDKDNLLQRYVAALLISKKECPETEQDIDKLKTFKLVGKKCLDLGCSIDDIKNLYNENKFGITKQTKQETTKTESEPESNSFNLFSDDISGNKSGGLFSDIFSDNDADTYNFGNEVIDFPKDYSLQYVLSKQLNITKPRGFKFVKHEANNYDYFYRPDYLSAYTREFIKLINFNNWTLYEDNNVVYKMSSNAKEMTEEISNFINNFITDNNRIIRSYLYNNDPKLYDINIIRAYVSPDNGMIFFLVRLKIVKPRYNTLYFNIITFTGKTKYNIIYDLSSKNKDIKNIKLQQNKIKKFKKFIKQYNGLRFNTTPVIFDSDNYPLLIIEMENLYVINYYRSFKKATYYYKEIPSNLSNVIYTFVSNNNNYLTVLFYADVEHKYTKKFNNVILIKLTDEGKKKFDQYENKG